ncbi:Gfo/Idh/MocA family protein [Cerasicoccus fimbriatus]|uniref:Gfo/Idh/MocA family protein n=1 Tax=Cerasicoccus fimbriatus TaxID=3014554 RepID=UPI0022B43F18|nr:Gfo/Idh/MocA family oxidoreductase [Cerasicoccus sp. TK19100]
MKKIGLIGGGAHSRGNHLPSLKQYAAEHPGVIELSAFCDIDAEVAQRTAAEFGFARHYTSTDDMLASESLDGVIAVTPVSLTKSIAEQLIKAKLPFVIEKPPGVDVAQAKEICKLVAENNARVMVSVNRRFDPALVAAKEWMTGRKVEFFRATMFRNERREPQFFSETGLHVVDAMRWFAGDIASYQLTARDVNGVKWYRVDIQFVSGVAGLLEVYPTAGMRDEAYEFFGDGFRVHTSNGEMSTGEFMAWENNRQVIHNEPGKDQPGYIKNGTLAETAEFIASLVENRQPTPTPQDVLPSLQLCCEILTQFKTIK